MDGFNKISGSSYGRIDVCACLWYQLNHHRQAGQRAFVFDVRNIPAKERMNDMIAFLDEMPQAITEYSDAITGRLVEKVTIFDEKIVVELKSGLQMEVEA